MDFQRAQRAFAAHIRHPDIHSAPADIEDRRMKIYRELFYNNIESFIANGFPVLRKVFDEIRWHDMIRDFMHRHKSQTPYFLEIAQEFLKYLDEERADNTDDYPFLLELAHYEWVELALDVDEQEIPTSGFNPSGDLMNGHPVISPLVWVLQYQYPVHRISPEFLPETPSAQPHFLLVYRNREYQVKFMEINAVTARLLTILQERSFCRGEEAITQLIEELRHPNPEVVYEGGRQALQDLLSKEIILGTALTPI